MSSTTDTTSARGQVLVVFALSLTALIFFAALAFDTGLMLLQRRDQQNAADAAALAGSYFLPSSTGQARTAARDIATVNGFTQGGTVEVEINIPPTSGAYTSGSIEVIIRDTRPSIFGGIMGVAGWPVGARAVAVNQDGVGAAFAMLALEPEDCDAILVSGSGNVTADGNIQVNSNCTNGALRRQGGGDISVTAPGAACNVHGDIRENGPGDLLCAQNEGAAAVPDPLSGLAGPSKPGYPADVVQVSGTKDIPNGCPGAVAPDQESTENDPITCQFTSSYAGTVWRLYPGYYPGGLHLQGGTFYWEPGIYWIGGGGLKINGNGTVSISVVTGGTTLNRGILLYNTENPEYSDECAAGTATSPATMCIQPINLDGASASIDFQSINVGPYSGLVIFQDRIDIPGDDVTINGSTSNTQLLGTIYVPAGDVKVNGSGGVMTTSQVIANTFKVNGAPGSLIDVNYDTDFIFKFTAAGLVE